MTDAFNAWWATRHHTDVVSQVSKTKHRNAWDAALLSVADRIAKLEAVASWTDVVEAHNALDAAKEPTDCSGSGARNDATHDFQLAQRLASSAGLRLSKRNETLYHLEPLDKSWLQNIFPGNHRLYYDRNRPQKTPYIKVENGCWALIDIVTETIKALAKEPTT